jgi:hypothetical protein
MWGVPIFQKGWQVPCRAMSLVAAAADVVLFGAATIAALLWLSPSCDRLLRLLQSRYFSFQIKPTHPSSSFEFKCNSTIRASQQRSFEARKHSNKPNQEPRERERHTRDNNDFIIIEKLSTMNLEL